MTDDQITALARELADDLYNDDRAYNSILWWGEEPKERKAEELEHTLHFLLRRYCLVEKSKLRELDIAHRVKANGYIALKRADAEYLFPDLGKEERVKRNVLYVRNVLEL